ncbi:MAG: NUDIX hydrolase [Patescibacteria group bacterium]
MTDFRYCPQCTKPLEHRTHQNGETFPTCPDGHFTHYDNPSPVAGAIIRQDGKYLVLKRNIEPSKGKWEIPGGFINAGETAEEAVIRELREETGLEVRIIRYIGSFASVYGDTGTRTVSTAYLVEPAGGTFALSGESQEHRWVGLDEFPEMAHADDQQAVDAFVAQERAAAG